MLAIAGLILLVVFLAVPALQRNFRNTSRRQDASMLYAAVQECMANNAENFNSCDEINEVPIDPNKLSIFSGFHFGASCSGNWFKNRCTSVPPTQSEPNWLNHLECVNGDSLNNVAESRKFVVSYLIETPGASENIFIPAGWSVRCLPAF